MDTKGIFLVFYIVQTNSSQGFSYQKSHIFFKRPRHQSWVGKVEIPQEILPNIRSYGVLQHEERVSIVILPLNGKLYISWPRILFKLSLYFIVTLIQYRR